MTRVGESVPMPAPSTVPSPAPRMSVPGGNVGSAPGVIAPRPSAVAPPQQAAPPRTMALDQVSALGLAPGTPPPATEITLGRDPACSIVIDNSVVSARHARITKTQPAGLLIDDLGSTNGTYVNGVRVMRQAITFRDDVRLGSAPVPLSDPRIANLLLRVVRRPAKGQPIVLGSAASSDVTIEYPDVAPQHAQIVETPDGAIIVRDLGAPAGTFIDGPHFRVTEARLQPNSLLLLGGFPLPVPLLDRLLSEAESGGSALAAAVQNVNLDRPVLHVGRGAENDLVLPHPTVSTRHARLTRGNDGTVRVEDLGSTNGTYVDGERVGSRGAIARPGQRVVVGAVALTIGQGGRIAGAQRAKVRLDLVQVGLTVPDRGSGKPRTLLDHVSMSIFPGELVGMLGPSGAGKSTLLMSVLGLYRPTHGGVLLNGRPLFQQYESFRTNVGYVPQDDIVHPQLTVREALWYACKLRLPSGTSKKDLDDAIEQTLKQVGLWEQRDLQIGSAEEKVLSGGQRRRVNLAVELVTDPSLLILDEPTSGLSWTDAADVVATLRRLADGGRTIVLTIHQPDYQEYEKFDTVAILGRGGKMLFYGPPSPDSYEFFGAAPSKPREMFDHVEQMPADEWRGRFQKTQTFQRFVTQRAPGTDAATQGPPPKPRSRSSLRQFPVLLARSLKLTLRNKTALLLLLLQAPLLGLLIGLTTAGSTTFAAGSFGCRDTTGPDTVDQCAGEDDSIACDPDTVQSAVQARVTRGEPPFSDSMQRWRDARIRDPRTGLLAILMALFLPMIIASSNVLVAERTIYERERLAGLNIIPYVLARFLVLAGLGAIVATLNLTVALPLLELRGNPFWYWLVGVMVTSCASAMGLALSAAVRNPVSALWGINFLVIPQLLFAGSITRLTGFTWLVSWFTTTRYALEALSNIDLRARGHLHLCQIERYMENFPGFIPSLHLPIVYAATGIGTLTFGCVVLTMLLLRLKDKRVG
ncbi:FHA domain-containing protein [Sandaracinus amylolyticus]|uniref:FHA domain-containing protein n=1 Tax=Sandaracinus amylolyticus TaxID=927083 RepID=UPI001EFF5FFB|nr:FHA domain-containing protein [Sandaracinus amylolyticus]UJR79354.1 Putative ATP-BINDING PROTEIN ABC TRANSPORTER [Sandaracinus amylolyticus]